MKEVHIRPARAPETGHSSIRAALSLYFTLLGLSVMLMIAMAAEAASEVELLILFDIVSCVVVVIWVAAGIRDIRPGLVVAGPVKWYAAAAAMALATYTVAAVLTDFVIRTLAVESVDFSTPFMEAGYGWWAVVLIYCVEPAIIEELAFRGVVHSALDKVLGARDAVIVSALMFMVLHLTVLSFFHLFLLGLLTGYLRVRSGSIYPCMLLHFIHNLLATASEMGGW